MKHHDTNTLPIPAIAFPSKVFQITDSGTASSLKIQVTQYIQVVEWSNLWKTSNPPCGGDPHTPLQRCSVLQTSTFTNPPTPQAARAAPSERKSGCPGEMSRSTVTL